MTRASPPPFVIGLGLSAFKALATALSMSLSSSSRRTRSSRLPSKPSHALSSESLIGATGLLSADAGHGPSAALAQLQATAALDE